MVFGGPFWGLGHSRGLFLGSWSTLGAPFSPNKLPASISMDSGSHLGSILRGFGGLGGVSWELLGGFLVVLGRFLREKAGNMIIHKNLRKPQVFSWFSEVLRAVFEAWRSQLWCLGPPCGGFGGLDGESVVGCSKIECLGGAGEGQS